MSKLPAIKCRKLIPFISELGYECQRTGKGSHVRYYFKDHLKGDGNLTIATSAATIPAGTLNGMLKLIADHTGLTVADLRAMLEGW